MSVTVRVPGKINLALRASEKQPDGYHQLATVFQAVSIFDEITVCVAEPGSISLTLAGDFAGELSTGSDNLAYKAAVALAAWADERSLPVTGVEIAITKAIPLAGGMAGGSADAAGTLLACARLWELPIGQAELLALGAGLGADVPFCILGGTVLGLGRGDILTPLQSAGVFHWVLVFSEIGLSTPAVFHELDAQRTGQSNVQIIGQSNARTAEQSDAMLVSRAGAQRTGQSDVRDAVLDAQRLSAWDVGQSFRDTERKDVQCTDQAVETLEIPAALFSALEQGDAHSLAKYLSNELQPAALALRPELAELLRLGVDGDSHKEVNVQKGAAFGFWDEPRMTGASELPILTDYHECAHTEHECVHAEHECVHAEVASSAASSPIPERALGGAHAENPPRFYDRERILQTGQLSTLSALAGIVSGSGPTLAFLCESAPAALGLVERFTALGHRARYVTGAAQIEI